MAAKSINPGCEEISGLLALYHYGELDEAGTALVKGHIDGCASCRAELAAISGMLGGIRPHEPHPFAVSRSVNRVKARIRRPRHIAWLTRLVPVALTAAIAVLAVAIYNNVDTMERQAELAMTTGPAEESTVAGTDGSADTETETVNEDEELLLALLDGPPAEPDRTLVPYTSTAAEAAVAADETETAESGVTAGTAADVADMAEEPPIYALVEMEPLSDMDVIHDLDMLEDFDTLAEIQEN